MRLHCPEHGYSDTWVGEICPKCQIAILREALVRIYRGDGRYGSAPALDLMYIAKEALQKAGGEG